VSASGWSRGCSQQASLRKAAPGLFSLSVRAGTIGSEHFRQRLLCSGCRLVLSLLSPFFVLFYLLYGSDIPVLLFLVVAIA